MILVKYTSRQGLVITSRFCDERQMWVRYAELVEKEVQTIKYAPTDSGDVRFNDFEEAKALGTILRHATIASA